MARALLMITEPAGKERPVWVGAEPVTVGRDAANEIAVDDQLVSRRHVRLQLRGSYVSIEDLDSTNGTFMNGYQVHEGEVAVGGEILIGETRICFVSLDEAGSPRDIPRTPLVRDPRPVGALPVAAPDGFAGVFRPREPSRPVLSVQPSPAHCSPAAAIPGPERVAGPLAAPNVRSTIRGSDFRHPWEIPVFIGLLLLLLGFCYVAVVLYVIVTVIEAIFTLGLSLAFPLVWLPLGILWIVGLFIAVVYQYYSVKSRYPEVSATSYPQVYAAATAAARRLNMSAPPVFVATDEREINAWATSLFRPLVVVNRGLIEAFGPECVQFVLGHEFGHIKLWHTPLGVLLHNEMMDSCIGQVLMLPCIILRLLLLGWDRLAEHSADRAGLLACGSLRTSVQSLLALRHGGHVNPADLQRQVDALRAHGDDMERWEALASTHPTARRRVNDLISFRKSVQGTRAAAKLGMSAKTLLS